MVEAMVNRSADLVLELENMGALFQRDEDGQKYSLRIDGGHSFPRCPFLEDRTGKEMVKAMAGILAKRNVDIYEKYPSFLAHNKYADNLYYQNFLLTSEKNRKKLEDKIKTNSKKKLKYD